MTGTTPAYGIRYPDGSTKAVNLGAELGQMATDVERALAAASLQPVTPAPMMVAQTAAARDAYWGVPGNETARRVLQGLGAQTVRPDKGWTEQYFATYDATTNPGGAAAAGWYPVSGRLPRVTLAKTSAQSTTPGAAPLLWDSATGTPGLWSSALRDRVRPELPGLWRVKFNAAADLQNTETFVGAVGIGGAQQPMSEHWVSGNSMGAASVLVQYDIPITGPTDISALVYAPALGAKGIYPAKASLTLSYLGPA